MRVVAHRGNRLHAPENSRAALVSAYTAGADVLELDVQLTRDDYLVVSHDGTTERLTGEAGRISEMTLAELRKLDYSETFKPRNAEQYAYYTRPGRKLAIETLPELLDALPRGVTKLIELKHDSSADASRRGTFVGKTIEALAARGLLGEAVIYSKDPENLLLARRLAPEVPVAVFDWELPAEDQVALIEKHGADGLVTDLDTVLGPDGALTGVGRALERLHAQRKLRLGAILYPFRNGGTGNFTRQEYEALRGHPFVWSLSTDSMLDVAPFTRGGSRSVDESFAGKKIDTERFALGYAKSNGYAWVHQEDGVRVKIDPYTGPTGPTGAPGSVERQLSELREQMQYASKDWPYYSGGGVGLVQGITGPFVAEVDYQVRQVSQATMLEMAVVNVDPGTHQKPYNADGTPRRVTSFRDKDSFFDPHGAPPFVGVEHDEDDGFRINWNLGTEYDNNQYGRPVGDGVKPRAGRLRLERRGPYFAAYYRNAVDAPDWVCVGVARNDSLNERVFLRCVAKRWRQEREDDPSRYYPILDNDYAFTNLTVDRFPG
ncbi:MAG TPA: glycerophosphodiester phosphodiesterase family protein [Longimicrobium sp.]